MQCERGREPFPGTVQNGTPEPFRSVNVELGSTSDSKAKGLPLIARLRVYVPLIARLRVYL